MKNDVSQNSTSSEPAEELENNPSNTSDVLNTASALANLVGHGFLRGSNSDSPPPSTEAATNTTPSTLNAPSSSDSNLQDIMNNLSKNDDSIGQSFLNFSGNKTGNISGSSFINAGQASFVLGIISNWYLLVAIPAMTVTYNVLKSLQEQGILDAMYKQVSNILTEMVELSSTCPQLIYDMDKFLKCFGW